MRVEWFRGDIIAANMGMKRFSNPVAGWLYDSNFLSAQAWMLLALELLVPLLLVNRQTRLPAVLLLIGFHIVNQYTMDIGMFSLLMLASLVLYWKISPLENAGNALTRPHKVRRRKR